MKKPENYSKYREQTPSQNFNNLVEAHNWPEVIRILRTMKVELESGKLEAKQIQERKYEFYSYDTALRESVLTDLLRQRVINDQEADKIAQALDEIHNALKNPSGKSAANNLIKKIRSFIEPILPGKAETA